MEVVEAAEAAGTGRRFRYSEGNRTGKRRKGGGRRKGRRRRAMAERKPPWRTAEERIKTDSVDALLIRGNPG